VYIGFEGVTGAGGGAREIGLSRREESQGPHARPVAVGA
jgi:hypothetical protein